jgi:hypothetical protein
MCIAASAVSQDYICEGVPQPSRSSEMVRIYIILAAITFPIFALRIFTRYKYSKICWDDWVLMFSAVSSLSIHIFILQRRILTVIQSSA